MLKKAFFGLFLSFVLISTALAQAPEIEINNAEPTNQESTTVNLYFFWGEGCPHCADEELFLKEFVKSYPFVKINDFEVWGSPDNRKFMIDAANLLGANVTGVPFTIIGDHYFIGWRDDLAGNFIEAAQCVRSGECPDPVTDFLGAKEGAKEPKGETGKTDPGIAKTIDLPLIGEINMVDFSLPVLTIIIAALDGFNPCAMWTLVFLIGLLVNMQNKRRMWILGSAFIIASAGVYFLFLAAWLNILLFIGFIVWVRAIIGLVALGGGGYYLKEFFTNKDNICKVTSNEKRQKTMDRLKRITQSRSFWLALIGIIMLAVAVNMIELICSAGLPAVYTQVLAMSDLAAWKYYAYLLLYVLVFMLDDLIIFFVAMTTLQVTGLTHKYSRVSHLIGGIVMVIIGLLLLFKPEWLMFG